MQIVSVGGHGMIVREPSHIVLSSDYCSAPGRSRRSLSPSFCIARGELRLARREPDLLPVEAFDDGHRRAVVGNVEPTGALGRAPRRISPAHHFGCMPDPVH